MCASNIMYVSHLAFDQLIYLVRTDFIRFYKEFFFVDFGPVNAAARCCWTEIITVQCW
jgi:hypothetical protein